MRWQDLEESTSVEDRRGSGRSGGFGGMGGFGRSGGFRTRGGIPLRGKTGLAVIIVVLVAGYYGIDLTPLITGEPFPVETQASSASAPYKGTAAEEELAKFSRVALKTTEEVWTEIFRASGEKYPYPKLVLYSGSTNTACGYGQAAMGPFYCPADKKVYLDLSFYNDMLKKLGGGGDFALGYVLAHEVGHHVQTLLGIGGGAQALIEELGVSNGPENVAVYGHILFVGGQYLGGRNVVELGGFGEIFHRVHKGQLEVQARIGCGGNDFGKPDGAGVFILPHGEETAGQHDHGQNHHGNQGYGSFFHCVSPPSLPTRVSRGRSICMSLPVPVLIYSLMPGRISEMAS